MNYGVGLPLTLTKFNTLVEYACAVEELGFDSIVTADHIFIGYEALTLLTAIAMKTQNLKLGTLVLDGNRRSPSILAHTTATLDHLSGGRLILGIGKGVFNETSYGITITKPVSRMLATVQVLKKLWLEDEVNYSCEFFQYHHFKLDSKPLQYPHPPIWIASFGKRMHRLATTYGDGFVTQNMPPELFQQYCDSAQDNSRKVGKKSVEAVYGMMPLVICEDRQKAKEMIQPAANAFLLRHAKRLSKALGYSKPWTTSSEIPENVFTRSFVYGTPEECANRITEYIKAGASYIVFQSVLPKGFDSLHSLAEALSLKNKG